MIGDVCVIFPRSLSLELRRDSIQLKVTVAVTRFDPVLGMDRPMPLEYVYNLGPVAIEKLNDATEAFLAYYARESRHQATLAAMRSERNLCVRCGQPATATHD